MTAIARTHSHALPAWACSAVHALRRVITTIVAVVAAAIDADLVS